jgi:hypothetical protein
MVSFATLAFLRQTLRHFFVVDAVSSLDHLCFLPLCSTTNGPWQAGWITRFGPNERNFHSCRQPSDANSTAMRLPTSLRGSFNYFTGTGSAPLPPSLASVHRASVCLSPLPPSFCAPLIARRRWCREPCAGPEEDVGRRRGGVYFPSVLPLPHSLLLLFS